MIVIGAGRVGTSLAALSAQHGIDVTVVDRHSGDQALDGPQGDPIVIATRNDDLVDVIERVPEHRREDLVFLQNGLIRSLLRNNQLVNNTRGLVYFAATARNGPIDPGTVSWFCGPHGLTMVRWLGHLGIRARVVDWARFSYYEFEKLAWLCALGAVCDAHDCTVGDAVDHHADDLAAVVDELARFGRAAMSVDAPPAYLLDRITDYSRSIPDFRASVKEWTWRNGAVLDTMLQHGVAMRHHVRLLIAGGHADKLSPEHRAPSL